MSRSTKLFLFVVGGIAALGVLVAAVAAVLLSMNAKPWVETLASQALDMEVHVGGRLALGVLPRLHLALADVHVRKRGSEVASVQEVELGFELLPLLHREVRIKTIGLKQLRIVIERGRDGRLNVARSSQVRGILPARVVERVSVSDATLLYRDEQSGQEVAVAGCTLNARPLRLSSGDSSDLLKHLSIAGKLACEQIRTPDFTAFDATLSVEGKAGIFDFDPVTMRLFGGRGSGSVRADLSGAVPAYRVRFGLTRFRIEEFFETLSPKTVAEGAMDFSANLSLRGKTLDALERSAAGEASLHGENLKLAIGDLDERFSRYESSQSFNLVDVAAVFFVGPLALGVTKGFDFARIFEGSEGSTPIRTLVSDWQVEHGVARARDVAMATPENRVALKGGLDFVDGRFDEVTVALIDAKGCPRIEQKVRGPFREPVVEKPSVLKALAGPARKLFQQAKGLFGGQCEVFYAGSVAPR
jgi:AsmA protein